MSRNAIRLQSGFLKGQPLKITQQTLLRPTSSRVRETLFNWLRGEWSGVHCLDLFAGSGVLGLEALANGATHCTFVEKDRQTARCLQDNITYFALASQATVCCLDYQKWLKQQLDTQPSFEGIFLDPPYAWQKLPDLLTQCLAFSPSWIYVEDAQPIERSLAKLTEFPYQMDKSQRAGQVYFALLRRKP